MGIDKRKLEGPLDDLRLAGLIEKTDWQPGKEQGYRLTRDGQAVVNSPGALSRIREGALPRGAPSTPEPHDDFEAAPPQPRRNAALASLTNSARPVLTYAVLIANVGLFLLAMYFALRGKQGGIKMFLLAGDADALHRAGGVRTDDLLRGQWWRLISSIFVHREIFHLLINLSTFMSISSRAEQIWGRWRYAAIFLLAGFGSICVTIWNDPTDDRLGGVAGAMCGLMLATAAWFFLNRSQMPREISRGGMRQIGLAFVWWMVWMGLIGWFGNVKFWWVGYVSGAAIGLLVGVLLNLQRYGSNPIRWAFLILVPIIPIVCVGLVLHSKQHDPRWRQVKEKAKEQKDSDEFKTFNKQILPELNKAEKFMEDPWDNTWNLLIIDPKDRPGDRVARTQASLREMREQIDQTDALIGKLGPFEMDKVATAIKAGRSFILEEKKLIEMTERTLDGGSKMTDQERDAVKDQVEEVQKQIRIYNTKFK